jgi:hypothetical protein
LLEVVDFSTVFSLRLRPAAVIAAFACPAMGKIDRGGLDKPPAGRLIMASGKRKSLCHCNPDKAGESR